MPTAKTTVKKEPANFYEDNYIPYRKCESGSRILRNPSEIYNYLLKKVYKQDPYCQDAAMILWNHCRGITSRNYVCGPAGSGKTYVWQCLQEIYPKIIIVDASTITADGWRGENKATTFLSQVDPADPDVIPLIHAIPTHRTALLSLRDVRIGDTVRVDRKGDDSLRIDNPFLSIL